MALRAVGNLTRCDENILRVVGYGVITGISKGIHSNRDRPEVLKLAAEVIGNLASLEDAGIDLKVGLRALREGRQQRNLQTWRRTQKEMKGPEEGDKPSVAALTKGRSRGWSALHRRMGSMSEGQRLEDKIKSVGDLRDAVCSYLYEDGAGKGLLEAMHEHPTDPVLGRACLRSITYISENDSVLESLVRKDKAPETLVYCMRACDYDTAFLKAAGRLLGHMVEHGPTREEVSMAAAPASLPAAFTKCYSLLRRPLTWEPRRCCWHPPKPIPWTLSLVAWCCTSFSWQAQRWRNWRRRYEY